MPPNDETTIGARAKNVVDLHPDAIGASGVLALAGRAARAAEEASQKAAFAHEESRRARKDIKSLRAEVSVVRSEGAENQAALLVALAQLAQSSQVQEVIGKQAEKAQFDAIAARRDAQAAQDKSEEITGQYNLSELARQSVADDAQEDKKIVRRLAVSVVTDEEARRAQDQLDRKTRNAVIWKGVRYVGLVMAAVVSSLLATRLGVHL